MDGGAAGSFCALFRECFQYTSSHYRESCPARNRRRTPPGIRPERFGGAGDGQGRDNPVRKRSVIVGWHTGRNCIGFRKESGSQKSAPRTKPRALASLLPCPL